MPSLPTPTAPPAPLSQRDPHTPTARIGALDCVLDLPGQASVRVDSTGRWCSARLDERWYRRTLDGGAVVYHGKQLPPEDVGELAPLHARIQTLAASFVARFEAPEEPLILTGSRPDRDALLTFLRRVEAWTPQAFEAEQARARAAYDEPVEILPPDRYLDLVVLAATGCPNATCTFCAFYQGRRFAVKSQAEFDAHLRAVVALMGPALGLRRGIFLGGASALSLSQSRLLAVLDQCRAHLGDLTDRTAAFWDPDHSPRRGPADWDQLAGAGVKVAYVGLETGLGALRAEVHKSGDITALAHKLRATTASQMRLGLVVLAGIGGQERHQAHLEATAELLGTLDLRRNDLVFISPLVGSMPPDALAEVDAALQQALKAASPARVVPYAMDDFRYYA